MKIRRNKAKVEVATKGGSKIGAFELPIDRRKPIGAIWNYAFLWTGQKKIGKTSTAIQGAEEFVIQFDKPQIAYELREECPKTWEEFLKILRALEKAAEAGTFPYNRVIIDGAGEWFTQCQSWACRQMGVESLGDAPYGKGWHKLRDEFNDAVNRLLRLQITAKCGLVFIAHAEWKETNTRSGVKIEKLVPSLPGRAEEIIGGKADGWFVFDWAGEDRVLVVQGDETISAGHRIDGRFLTTDGRRVREIYLGESPAEALLAIQTAFDNEQTYATYKEFKAARDGAPAKPRMKLKRK